MEAKFSYFDFIAYFVPGALLLGVALILASVAFPEVSYILDSDILVALSFSVAAYITGHVVQARARYRFEDPSYDLCWRKLCLRKRVFVEGIISELFLIRNAVRWDGLPYCHESIRKQYVEALRNAGVIAEEGESLLEAGVAAEGCRSVSHGAYRRLYSYMVLQHLSDKADRANESYNLYRGLSQAFLYVSVLVLGYMIHYIYRVVSDPGQVSLGTGAVMVALPFLFGMFSRLFRIRAMWAALNHVREVLDGFFMSQRFPQENK